MGDMGDIFNAMKEESKQRRANNRESSADILTKSGIEFESKNLGAHLIVGQFDFWPGTGLFINRKTGKRGRGVRNLIKLLRSEGGGG